MCIEIYMCVCVYRPTATFTTETFFARLQQDSELPGVSADHSAKRQKGKLRKGMSI